MEKKLLKRIEDMDDNEREKLRELLKDSKSDGTQKMKWMYQDKVDSEEYLLGRRIDKAMVEPETTNKEAPGALFSEVISRRSELDMQVKMREDPLYMIRKREEEAKRKLLENPIKMKQLQKVIDERQRKTKKKKKKVKKKKERKGSSSSSDDSDDELLKKYLSIVEQKKMRQSRTDDESKHSRVESVKRRDAKDRHVVEEHDTHNQRQTDSRRGAEQASKKRHDDERHVSRSEHRSKHHRKSSRDRDVERRSESRSSSGQRKSRSRSPLVRRPEGYGLIKRGDQSLDRVAAKPSATSDRKSPVQSSVKVQPKPVPTVKRKLTAEEMERKRLEMMSNAKERDEQRHKNVKQYELEDEREKRKAKEQVESHDVDFVKPLMMTHAAHSSVEDRIKRNVYNIQRTNADLDRNFARK